MSQTTKSTPLLAKIQHTVTKEQFYSGLIPHHDSFRSYEEVLPGSANRILIMAEKQEDHRIVMEKKQQEHSANQSKAGLNKGFIILMTVIITGAVLLILGKPIEGFSAMVLGLGSMFFGYLKAIHSQKKERLQRVEMLQKITNPPKTRK